MPRLASVLPALFALIVSARAGADPIVLRFGTVAPDGTDWARIAKQTGADLAAATRGAVVSKWYFGGIAGDELQMLARIRKEQLDGIVSAGMLCTRLSPSMRVLRLIGLFQTRDESGYVAGRLKAIFDEEFRKEGFVNLGDVGIGPDLVFSRTPIRSMDELRKTPLWTWSLDDVYTATGPLLGARFVPLPINDAFAAYDQKRIDGFIAVPTAALGFQWSTEARYVTDLRVSFLRACILISTRAFDPLPLEARTALLNSSARGMKQLEERGREQDEELLGRLFAHQGMTTIHASETFRADFFAQALAAREKLVGAGRLVRPDLLQRVLTLLADFRAEHHVVDGDHRR